MLRKIGIIAVLSLIVAAVAAVPALAVTVGPVDATSTTKDKGLHFVGTPTVTAHKNGTAWLEANGEVAGAGKKATATLSSKAEVTTGCINRGSQGQQPKGLKRSTTTTNGSTTFDTHSGRGTFSVETSPRIDAASRNCPDDMTPVLVSVTFTDITLTVKSAGKEITATFDDIDP
jgi:hypothetical protein